MKIIRKAVAAAIVFLFIVLVLVVFYQVVARYILNSPPAWTEELARYCQVWIILLTSSLCIRKGSHLAVDYFSHRLSPQANRILELIRNALMVMYILVVIFWGWKLMMVGQYQLSPGMQIKMSYVYLIFPLSGVLMLLEAVIRTASLIKRKE